MSAIHTPLNLRWGLSVATLAIFLMVACSEINEDDLQQGQTTAAFGPLEGVEHSTVDHTISAFQINPALLTAGDRQYVAYYDSLHNMTVAVRSLPDGEWDRHPLDSQTGWDSHNGIVMARSADGCLHIAGNMHSSPLVYFSSDPSGDIRTLRRVPMLGQDEDHVTYPAFLHDRQGRLIFHYRDGESGNGREIFNILGDDGIWQRLLDKPLLDGEGINSAYIIGPTACPDGNFHMTWMWRSTSDCSTNHDLFYARSVDLIHWESAAGQALELPILASEGAALVDATPEYGGLLNIAVAIGFDTNARPLIFYHKYDSSRCSQLYLARPGQNGWDIAKQTDWKDGWRWNFGGDGSIERELELENPRLMEYGRISLTFQRINTETGEAMHREIPSSASTLSPGRECAAELPFPSHFYQSVIPEGRVHIIPDSGDGGYILRWESLKDSRDFRPIGPLPKASPLDVIRSTIDR